ncbi:MAG: MBG domain-containing protein [Opitutaceae bacterium]
MKSMQAVCSKLRRGIDRVMQVVVGDITPARFNRRRAFPWTLSCLALGLAPIPAQSASVLSQSGISYTGTVNVTALGDVIGMTGSTAFPAGGFTLGNFAFRGAITVGTDLWLLPNDANQIVKVDTLTGTMTGYNLPGVGTTQGKFVGGAYDGTYIWLVPFDANAVVRFNVATQVSDIFNNWPSGVTVPTGSQAFAGAVFVPEPNPNDGGFVWLVPYNAGKIVGIDVSEPNSTQMIGVDLPGGYTPVTGAFWGGLYDGTNLWLVPFNADVVIKMPTSTQTPAIASGWPTGFTIPDSAFAGGTFDGTSVWLAPYDADRAIAINVTTDVMTGYGSNDDATQWPATFTKGADASFNGAVYDGADVWLVPFEADHMIKINPTTGVMTGYTNFPAAVARTDLDKFAGAVVLDESIYLVPGTLSGQTLVEIFPTDTPAVASIVRHHPTSTETNANTVLFRATFDKPVTGVDASDFTLTATGTASGAIASFAPNSTAATSFVVTVGSVAGDGTLRLDLKASGTAIVDEYSNPTAAGFTTGEVFTIDNTAPVITSAMTASGAYDTALSLAVTASGTPIIFDAPSGSLPPGIALNAGTGSISGSPTAIGTYNVTLSATDSAGNSGSGPLEIQIAPKALTVSGVTASDRAYDSTTAASLSIAGATLNGLATGDVVQLSTSGATAAFANANVGANKPVTASGLTLTGADAGNYTLTQPSGVTASITPAPVEITLGGLSHTYDGVPKSATASTSPAGIPLTITYDGGSTSPTPAGSYAVVATVNSANYSGTESDTLVIDKAPATVAITNTAFVFDGTPKPVTVTTTPAGLTVDVTYNGSATVPSAAGSYAVVATINEANFAGTASANLVIGSAARLINIAARADVGTGDNILISGFVINGSGSKRVLLRGIGPGLEQHGITDYIETPTLRLLDAAGGELASNTGWGTSPDPVEIAEVTLTVGAFGIEEGSADSVILATLPPGSYTIHLAGVNNTTGVGLVEVYDADEAVSTARLVNVSARAVVGVGNDVLIPGFVIEGDVPRKILVRAVGPTLADDVAGVLTDPVITVYQEGAPLESNDDWGQAENAAEIAATAGLLGAFPLDEGGKDAALLIELQPGPYTVNVSGVGQTSGVALVELYQLD